MVKSAYFKKPIRYLDEIPLFSETDFYIENYERISADHLKHFVATGHNPFMDEEHWEEIEQSTVDLIKKYSSNEVIKILDVGVGMGRLLEKFPDFERFGMDVSLGYLQISKDKGIEVCMSLIDDMPYLDEYFDMVISTDVLEHVLDLNASIEKILSVLKPGGIFILRVPYKEDLKHYLSDGYPYDLVHLRTFDEHVLRLLFEKIFRLKVVEFNTAGCGRGQLRCGIENKYFRWFIRESLNIIKLVNLRLYKNLSNFLYYPAEINFVVIKESNEAD